MKARPVASSCCISRQRGERRRKTASPGRTLSNSDSFWFKAPWAAQKPAALTRPSNPEFDDAFRTDEKYRSELGTYYGRGGRGFRDWD